MTASDSSDEGTNKIIQVSILQVHVKAGKYIPAAGY